MLEEVEHPAGFSLKIPNSPIRLSRTPGGIQGPPPALGEHTDEVLTSLLALSDREIADLRAEGVVYGPLPSPVPWILEREQQAQG
jgi:crotonobetainyl-CoA:carnitine CoA-transferase CaiB-like acyl-CoA transferase